MKRFEPLVVLRDAVTRWDVLAFIVVIGLIVFLGVDRTRVDADFPGSLASA